MELTRRRPRLARGPTAAALATAIVLAGAAAGSGSAIAPGPHPTRIRCEQACAGQRAVAARSVVRWTGAHLGAVVRIDFPVAGGSRDAVAPTSAARHSLKAVVPGRPDLATGRPILRDRDGRRAAAPGRLRIVAPSRIPAPGSFRLLHGGVRPRPALFDAPARLRYRFRARGRTAVELRIVRARSGDVVRRWVKRGVTPYARHGQGWTTTPAGGGVLRSGRYVLRIGPPGGRGRPAARFRVLDGEFPVRGPHSFGGPEQRFGAPRSGGRVHQGQDILAACGTREVAARGGRVQARGYDPALYGNWLVIDTRGSSTDYRYAHLIAPTPLHTGQRIRTGQTVGRVGRTGNARTVGCMLHFELWPGGWLHGGPIDPLPTLIRWGRRS